MAGRSAILAIRVVGDTTDAKKALGAAGDDTAKWAGRIEGAALPAAAALAAVGAGAVKLAQGAAEDAAGAEKLATALRNTTGATDQAIAKTEDWIAAQGAALGVADDQLRPALASLATATGDVTKAQELAALAMDVAAARGIPVEQAADAIAKAYAGQTTAIGRLVPGIDKAALASGDFATVQEELAGIVGGQAATAAGTAQGQYERLQLSLAETGETIGAALLPMIEKLLPMLRGVADWVGKNSKVVLILGGTIAALAAAILVVNGILKAYRVMMIAIRAAKVAWVAVNIVVAVTEWAVLWPILLIVAAVALLIAGIVLLVRNWDTVCGWFETAWKWLSNKLAPAFDAVSDAISSVVGWLKSAWDWIQKIVNSGISKVASLIPGGNMTVTGGLASTTLLAGPAPAATSAAAAPVTINFNGPVGDPHAISRELRRLFRDDQNRLGRAGRDDLEGRR